MPDFADKSSSVEQFLRKNALAQRKPTGPSATGHCLNCGLEQEDKLRRWCDATCRDIWEAKRGA